MNVESWQVPMRPSAALSDRVESPRRCPGWVLVWLAFGTVSALAQSSQENAPAASVSSAPMPLDAAARREIVEKLAQKLVDRYAVAESGAQMAQAIRAKLAAGGYDKITAPEEFARTLHADIR